MNKKLKLMLCTLVLTILCATPVFAAKEPIVKINADQEVDLSACNASNEMTIYAKVKVNETNAQKGEELINTYLFSLSKGDDFPVFYAFIAAENALYVSNDLRTEIQTRSNAVPIGEEFDLIVTLTNEFWGIYVNGELIASFDGSDNIGGSIGGAYNVINGVKDGTTNFAAVDKSLWKNFAVGRPPKCLDWDLAKDADMEMIDFQVYDSALTVAEVDSLHNNGVVAEAKEINKGESTTQNLISDIDTTDNGNVGKTVGMIIGIIVGVVVVVIAIVIVASISAKKKK